RVPCGVRPSGAAPLPTVLHPARGERGLMALIEDYGMIGDLETAALVSRGDTLVLETTLETDGGAVRLVDFMPPRETKPDLVRIVEGVRGRVEMRMELVIRFDYGSIVPWVRNLDGTLVAIAGPDAVLLRTPVEHEGRDLRTHATFTVA